MNIAGKKRPQEEAEIKTRNMTTEQNMLIFSQQDTLSALVGGNFNRAPELDPHVHVFSRRLAFF